MNAYSLRRISGCEYWRRWTEDCRARVATLFEVSPSTIKRYIKRRSRESEDLAPKPSHRGADGASSLVLRRRSAPCGRATREQRRGHPRALPRAVGREARGEGVVATMSRAPARSWGGHSK